MTTFHAIRLTDNSRTRIIGHAVVRRQPDRGERRIVAVQCGTYLADGPEPPHGAALRIAMEAQAARLQSQSEADRARAAAAKSA